jgi:hypothetical protein
VPLLVIVELRLMILNILEVVEGLLVIGKLLLRIVERLWLPFKLGRLVVCWKRRREHLSHLVQKLPPCRLCVNGLLLGNLGVLVRAAGRWSGLSYWHS